jgi:hypothetical protein
LAKTKRFCDLKLISFCDVGIISTAINHYGHEGEYMSDNKFNYFEVTTSFLVRARNKSEAEKTALGRKNTKGEILSTNTAVERISAVEVREMLEIQ